MIDQLYLRYVVASAASLAVDFATFMACLTLGVPPALAAAVGYIAGVVCHWFLSSRAVFVGQLAEVGTGRRQQQGLFALSALAGLAVTVAIVGIGTRYGLDPRLSKVIAIVVSFQATYVLRKKVVFA